MPSAIDTITFDAHDPRRVADAGATIVREDDGWIVLQDPEGNEFCVLDGPADGSSEGSADG